MLNNKRLLILGGDMLSADLVLTAQEMGVFTVVTDWYDIQKSPAKLIADKSYNISTTDTKSLIELIEKENIDGVLTGFTDSALMPYVKLCDKANIPCYISKEQVDITTDKNQFKHYCSKHHIPIIKEYKLDYPFIDDDLANISFPVIVKPADNSGARGIRICNNVTELKENYKYALSFSESKQVLIEQYVVGKEATVFYLAVDGEYHLIAMGDRHIKVLQEGHIPLPVGYVFPSQYLGKFDKELNDKFKNMLADLQIKNGLIFIQSLIDGNGEIVPYEMGYRLTGSLEYKLTDSMYNINAAKMLIRYALTGTMVDKEDFHKVDLYNGKKAANLTFLSKAGIINKIIGIDEIKQEENVISCKTFYNEKDEVSKEKMGTLLQVVSRVLMVAKSYDELFETMNKVTNLFDIESSDKNSLLLKTFDVSEIRKFYKN